MPIPPPVLAAGLGLVGGVMNSVGQSGQNRASRRFATQMYGQQRYDNLQDWHRENAYNSPIAQMQRLKEAGINPTAMLGKSASSGIAGQVKSADIKNPQFNNPEWGGSLQYLPNLFDFEVKQAQANNLEKQATTETQRQLLIAAQAQGTKADAEVKEATKAIAIQSAEQDLKKKQADTQFQLDENERRAMLAGGTMSEKMANVQRIRIQNAKTADERKNLQAMLKEIQTNTALKQYELKLRESNVYKDDGLLARIIARLLHESGGVLQLKNKLENLIK